MDVRKKGLRARCMGYLQNRARYESQTGPACQALEWMFEANTVFSGKHDKQSASQICRTLDRRVPYRVSWLTVAGKTVHLQMTGSAGKDILFPALMLCRLGQSYRKPSLHIRVTLSHAALTGASRGHGTGTPKKGYTSMNPKPTCSPIQSCL